MNLLYFTSEVKSEVISYDYFTLKHAVCLKRLNRLIV